MACPMTEPADSNPNDHDVEETTAATARDWIVRLASGHITEEELHQFKGWLAERPSHRQTFERERMFWQQLDQLERVSGEWTGDRDRLGLEQSRSSRRPARRAVLVGGLIAACVTLIVLYQDIRLFLMADHRTAVGQQQVVTLPDGSVVHLNTDTALAMSYAANERRIDLLKGEALFTVMPDPQKPFRVLAQGGTTQAVGTAFVVQAQEQQTSVTVAEGIVEVSAADSSGRRSGPSIAVHKDQQTSYRPGTAPQAVANSDSHAVTAWTRGAIVIEAQPFAQAMAELDRYRPGRIVVLADASRTKPVSGRFTLAGIDDALTALATTQGLSVVHMTTYLVLIL
ncbi:MAG: FecR domain-containing protein [Nitrospira sp.]|nr:FecR domain-containing protein [Nitrospira sp.]